MFNLEVNVKNSVRKHKLKSAPIKLVICKIDCADLVNFESKYLGDVQDELRKNGFPHHLPHITNDLQINVQNGLQINQQETKQHHFIDVEQESGVAIIGGQFFVYTRNYKDFDSYIKIVEMAFSIYQRITEQQFVKSISIRYVDNITIDSGETLNQYLNESILSPNHESKNLKSLEARSQYAYQSEHGSILYLRPVSGRNLKGVPDDLSAILEPMKKLNANNSEFDLFNLNQNLSAIIDTDHVVTYAKLMNSKEVNVFETLRWLHVYSSNIFFDSVTDYAIEKWSS
ncbi:TIGR04255 family protein [Colwellia sp. M166]|nr:TIGR04255 family protein [Colwellia sp. M166]|tara:strand:- start:1566 stop:2423 length:858 start_codon:yes stop_codon:yes gene_type:complete